MRALRTGQGTLSRVGTWIITETAAGSGLRVAVKDLIDMAGLPTTAGSRAIAEQARPAAADAPCVAGLRRAQDAGEARFAGKTNLHELAYGITGVNAWSGTPVNPLDPRRVPGVSSRGSATAVAAGEADIAYGTDTGGSIRIPAACCGITGLKTTWGRIPLDGVRPLAPSLDTVGPMARDVNGLAAGMALLEPGFTVAGTAPLTIGMLAIDADPAITEAIGNGLRTAGFDVQPVTVPELDAVIAASLTILEAEAWATNAALVATSADKIGADVRDRLRRGSAITSAQLTAANQEVTRWKAALGDLWRRVELLAASSRSGEHAQDPRADRAGEHGRPSGARPAGPRARADAGERPADRAAGQRGPAASRGPGPRAGAASLTTGRRD